MPNVTQSSDAAGHALCDAPRAVDSNQTVNLPSPSLSADAQDDASFASLMSRSPLKVQSFLAGACPSAGLVLLVLANFSSGMPGRLRGCLENCQTV